jgi:plasmid maintenance system antidote protein VapI
MSVTELARRLSAHGHPLRRETLSRILNGKQPTTWDTAERIADILGVAVAERPAPDGRRPPPALCSRS